MELKRHTEGLPQKIAIIGAGFSGTALAAAFHRLTKTPIEIVLFDKSGSFGAGNAYSTPFPFHLLNVRARDMSAFEDESDHFVNWLKTHQEAAAHLDQQVGVGGQFLPRFIFGNYLKHLLNTIQSDAAGKTTLTLEPVEVIDILPTEMHVTLVLSDHRKMQVDKVVLALGNNAPAAFPFPVAPDVQCINNPWDYNAPTQIATHDPVLMVGTGLSMIDAVLTLHHQHHQGVIYAVSRHGLLPLPHADSHVPYLMMQNNLPPTLRALTKNLRTRSQCHVEEGGDWRSVINAIRAYVPEMWGESSLQDKKRFLRHVLPYWNIHRHRVNNDVANFLKHLSAKQQLKVFGGRIASVANEQATIKLRHTHTLTHVKTKWLINCMGPALKMSSFSQPLIQSLLRRGLAVPDPLDLGFSITSSLALKEASGKISTQLYTLGPPAKAASWECGAVPEIRKQSFNLAKYLLNQSTT